MKTGAAHFSVFFSVSTFSVSERDEDQQQALGVWPVPRGVGNMGRSPSLSSQRPRVRIWSHRTLGRAEGAASVEPVWVEERSIN